ncbi:MAG: noncanonical pyrimidine nucleotidase, YjjG family [Bacteroidia bacterium]|nr:noncanonical pyrimidine nucleotidase, YjjG family [Bacteroidia bacterium]
MKYKNIFFDFDHTLWDADTNAYGALNDLYRKHSLHEKGIHSFEEFVKKYIEVNELFWDYYAKGKVGKQTLRYQRFLLTLKHFGVKNYDLSYTLTEEYTDLASNRGAVQPHTYEVLNYLRKKYTIHILTNGFEEIQLVKMRASKLDKYFNTIITADKAGAKKPSPEIFEYALNKTKAVKSESLMVGDNLEVDIAGARAVGIDQVFYNFKKIKHNESATYEIVSLKELMEIV